MFRNARNRFDGILRQVEKDERPRYRSAKWRKENPKKRQKGPPGDTVLWIPYRSKNYKEKIERIVANSGLKLQVKERAGTPITRHVRRSAFKPRYCKKTNCKFCDGSKDIKVRKMCMQKDLVYKGVCKICGKAYTGETKQFLGCRVDQHFTQHGSAMCQHIEQEHSEEEKVSFIWSIYAKTRGYVERKITEAVALKQNRFELNRKAEGNGVVDLYF